MLWHMFCINKADKALYIYNLIRKQENLENFKFLQAEGAKQYELQSIGVQKTDWLVKFQKVVEQRAFGAQRFTEHWDHCSTVPRLHDDMKVFTSDLNTSLSGIKVEVCAWDFSTHSM